MPIYEYVCESCHGSFEQLVMSEEKISCPNCQSVAISKQHSRFGLGSTSNQSTYNSLPLYKGGGCCCTPGTCGCKN